MYSKKQNHNFVLANLFSYLSLHLSSKKNVPNSYLKLLNEISNYLYPSLGISDYYLAELDNTNDRRSKISIVNKSFIYKKFLRIFSLNDGLLYDQKIIFLKISVDNFLDLNGDIILEFGVINNF